MKIPEYTNWNPLKLKEIQTEIGEFYEWCLCGGESVDLIVGKKTRKHGDIDIGVFRSDLIRCLTEIGNDRVFLADPPGHLKQWDGEVVPANVNDIWIASATLDSWVLQILVYSDDEENVYFKRDENIHWNKANHTCEIGGYQILNPFITVLYKSSRATIESKDAHDICLLVGVLYNKKFNFAPLAPDADKSAPVD
jgi:hypothetical protein